MRELETFSNQSQENWKHLQDLEEKKAYACKCAAAEINKSHPSDTCSKLPPGNGNEYKRFVTDCRNYTDSADQLRAKLLTLPKALDDAWENLKRTEGYRDIVTRSNTVTDQIRALNKEKEKIQANKGEKIDAASKSDILYRTLALGKILFP